MRPAGPARGYAACKIGLRLERKNDAMQPRERILVLLVEDEPDLMELEQMVLEDEGFLVVTARDGERALRLLDVVRPSVIVTDLMMPVLDGFGLIERCRERSETVPMIAISSFEGYLARALELGAAGAVPKPLDIGQLVRHIDRAVASEPAPPLSPSVTAEDEAARLGAVLDLALDQPAAEPSLQRFIDVVARNFGVPIALLSAITQDQQFWSASCGLPADMAEEGGGPRGESFCTHAVAARAALVVQDTVANPFFRDNPLVTDRGLRFYAGVPLIARHGEALGTLCLLDYQAHRFTHFDLELLTVFGNRVLAELEWREHRRSPEIPRGAFRYLDYVDTDLNVFGKLGFEEIAEVEGARAAELKIPIACAVMAVPYRRLETLVQELTSRSPVGLVGRLGHARIGWIVPGQTSQQARAEARELAGPHGFAAAVELGRFSHDVRTALRQLEADLGDAGLA